MKNLIQRPLNALAPLQRSAVAFAKGSAVLAKGGAAALAKGGSAIMAKRGSAVAARPAVDWSPVRAEIKPDLGRTIRVQNLVKEYHTSIGRRRILDDISFDVAEGEKVAVLGRNGAGKSTLIKLISGVETPTSGSIEKGMFMSWPLGFAGGLEGEMTGRDNARFIARLYDKDVATLLDFVDDFAELGRQIDISVRNYSTGMRMRLAFALTLAVDFECFLIDEVLSVGDQRFHRKCHDALFVQRKHCSMLLISHDTSIVREFCQKAVILKAGRGRVFTDIDQALSIYQTL